MNKIAKYATMAGLAFATYCGTFRNNSGFPLVYNHITRDGSGICLGLLNELDEGVTFNGVVGSLLGNYNSGKINGASLAVGVNAQCGDSPEVIGLEMAIGNSPGNMQLDGSFKGNDRTRTTYGIGIGVIDMGNTTDKGISLGFGPSGVKKSGEKQ